MYDHHVRILMGPAARPITVPAFNPPPPTQMLPRGKHEDTLNHA